MVCRFRHMAPGWQFNALSAGPGLPFAGAKRAWFNGRSGELSPSWREEPYPAAPPRGHARSGQMLIPPVASRAIAAAAMRAVVSHPRMLAALPFT
jgi:hypothetical protein